MTRDDGLPLTNDERAVLGTVAMLGALVEAVAEGILAKLVSEHDWEHVINVIEGQPLSWCLERIKAVNSQSPRGSDDIAAWAIRAKEASERRNQLVHAVWLGEHQGSAFSFRSTRRGPRFNFLHPQDIEAVRDELALVHREGREVSASLHFEP